MASSPVTPEAAQKALTLARMSYAAGVVGIFTSGMYIVLAVICLHLQFTTKRRVKPVAIIAFTIATLVVSMIYFVAASIWSSIAFVESGSAGTYIVGLSNRMAITKNAASTLNTWLADGLVVYRAWIIWGRNRAILALPTAMFAATIAVGTALLVETSKPNTNFGAVYVVRLGTAFWSISIALNILVTILIAGKLIYHQRQLRRILSHHSGGTQYTSIVAILAESAALYSICGLVYIPLFALNLPIQYPFSALLNGATSIAPTLIILRLSLGIAYTPETMSNSQQSASILVARTVEMSDSTANISSSVRFSQSKTQVNQSIAGKEDYVVPDMEAGNQVFAMSNLNDTPLLKY